MKLKRTSLMIIICLTILLPTVLETSASVYTVSITRSPLGDVYAGENVYVNAIISGMVRDEEIITAKMSCSINGQITSIYPEESLPMLENTLTYDLGSFDEDDIVQYKLIISFQLQNEKYGYDYAVDEWYQFIVLGGSRPVLSATEIILIVGGVAIIVIAIYVVIRRKKK